MSGFPEYDTQLEDYTAATLEKQRAALHVWEKKIAAIDPMALDAPQAADSVIFLNCIRAAILSMEVVRPLEKNPDAYSSGATNSIFVLMERPFAPANTRLRAVVEREKLIPLQLLEARQNLKNPPKISTEIALEQIDGLVSFFQTDVPSAFTDATDAAVKAEFAKSNAEVIEALQAYGVGLKEVLLPRSNGDFKLGADPFR